MLKNYIMEISTELEKATTIEQVESIRSHYIGIGGILIEEYKRIGNYLSIDERKSMLDKLNKTKNTIKLLLQNKKNSIIHKQLQTLIGNIKYGNCT